MTNVNIKMARRALSFLVLIALMAGSVLPAAAQTRRTRRRTPRLGTATRTIRTPAQPAYYTVNAGETISVRMNQQISSQSARVGDTFTTTTTIPVYANGVEVIPAGSTITGRIESVKRASRPSKAGVLGVHFISLRLPNGATRAINGDLSSLSSENNTYDNEGQVSGRSSTKRNIVFIGGGAAAGALIGAIAGGGRGAAAGSGVGAGLGVAGALLSKGQDAVVKPGAEFGVVLNQSISLPQTNVR